MTAQVDAVSALAVKEEMNHENKCEYTHADTAADPASQRLQNGYKIANSTVTSLT